MEMKITIIVAIISSIGGAIAGGAVSFASQFLLRKWQKEDGELQNKKNLYSEIISTGGRFIGEEISKKLNRESSMALLSCGKKVGEKIIRRMVIISNANSEIPKESDQRKKDDVAKRFAKELAEVDNQLVDAMREELKIK